MANFVDVMKKGARMCNTMLECKGCPLEGIKTGDACMFTHFADIPDQDALERIENDIVFWAETNPDPDGSLHEWLLGNLKRIHAMYFPFEDFGSWLKDTKLSDPIAKSLVENGGLNIFADHPDNRNRNT